METLIKASDQIIAISKDDDTIQLSSVPEYKIDTAVIHITPPSLKKPEHTLILGWNRRGSLIIEYLDFYVAPNSKVMVVADLDDLEEKSVGL